MCRCGMSQPYSHEDSSAGYTRPTFQLAPTTATSDDDDSDSTTKSVQNTSRLHRQKRREAHTHAEQKRRDAIRRGYDLLQELVPGCQTVPTPASSSPTDSPTAASSNAATTPPVSGVRMSKAAILQRAIEYTERLVKERRQLGQQLESLRRELLALQILRSHYQQLVRSQQSNCGGVGGAGSGGHPSGQLCDQLRFRVFRSIADRLFDSFNSCVVVDDFTQLSSSMIMWIEEEVKPQALRQICIDVVNQLNSESET